MPFRKARGFPPVVRLHHRREYDLVWKRGRRHHTQHFQILIMPKMSGPTRLGITVSRKIGGAVARNRLKRLLREFFRLHYEYFIQSVDLVIVAKKGAVDLTYACVCSELGMLLAIPAASRTPCAEPPSSS